MWGCGVRLAAQGREIGFIVGAAEVVAGGLAEQLRGEPARSHAAPWIVLGVELAVVAVVVLVAWRRAGTPARPPAHEAT